MQFGLRARCACGFQLTAVPQSREGQVNGERSAQCIVRWLHKPTRPCRSVRIGPAHAEVGKQIGVGKFNAQIGGLYRALLRDNVWPPLQSCCDELVYIAYGHVLARGDEREVLRQAGVESGNLEDAFIALIARAKDNFADARQAL